MATVRRGSERLCTLPGCVPGMSVLKFVFLVVIAGLAKARLLVGVVLGLLFVGTLTFEQRGTHSALLFGVLLVFWAVLRVRRFVRVYKSKRDEGYYDHDEGDE